MRHLSRPLSVMIGLQAICLGVGFWFQHQLVVLTTQREAMESAWTGLVDQASHRMGTLRKLMEKRVDSVILSTAFLEDSLEDNPSETAFLVIDGKGLIVGGMRSAMIEGLDLGDKVVWKLDRMRSKPDEPFCGRIATPLGDRHAIQYTFPKNNSQVIFYEIIPSLISSNSSLQRLFAVTSGLGFLLTLSLSSMALFLLMSRFNLDARIKKAELDHEALKNAQDLLRTRDAVIFGLAKLAESRDPETGHHLERISLYTTRIATALRRYPKYQEVVTPTYVRLLGISSVLHDIGKVGVEDMVLLKPGKLNSDERERMQLHTLVAGDCLKEIEERLGASNFLQTAREIALYHHERWDGLGYPCGLMGESIPLAARIVAIADVYDALSSKRIYKEAFPHEACVRAILEGAGSQFDPELVEVFMEIQAEFAAISQRFVARSEVESNEKIGINIDQAYRMVCQSDAEYFEPAHENPSIEAHSDLIEVVA